MEECVARWKNNQSLPQRESEEVPDTYGSTTARVHVVSTPTTLGRPESPDQEADFFVGTATQELYSHSTSPERKFDVEQDSYISTAPHAQPDSASMAASDHPTILTDPSQSHAGELQPTGGVVSEDTSNHLNEETVSLLNTASVPQRITDLPNGVSPPPYTQSADDAPNVVIFGETGVGKSSLINMITGAPCASVSSAAVGCTFESVPYDAELSGRKYRLWDTVGLNEGEQGNVSADRAIESLQELVLNLQSGGVSLLVYCIRGSRLRDIVKINYDIFSKVICGGQVPIVIVVTGLENEDNMEDWWTDNAVDFDDRGMRFAGHACITTAKGKIMKDGRHMFEEEYNQSVKLVHDLIIGCCPETSWKSDSSRWFGNIVENMRQMYAVSSSGNQALGHGGSSNQAQPVAYSTLSINPQTDYERSRQELEGHGHTVPGCTHYLLERFLLRLVLLGGLIMAAVY